MPKEYQLKGMVIFKLPSNTRRLTQNVVRHFTAVNIQNNNVVKHDECKNKPQKLPAHYKVNIQIAIYKI